MTILFLLCTQDICKTRKRLLTVHRPGRIVRRIYENGRHIRIQHLFKFLKINLKCFRICRNHFQYCSARIDIRKILRKQRCKRDDLIPGLCHTADRMCQRTCRTGSHKNMLRLIVHAEPSVQAVSHDPAHLRISERRAVAVQRHRIFFLMKPDHRIGIILCTRYARIAKAVIKYIFISNLRSAGRRVLAQLTDHRFSLQHCLICLVNHALISPLYSDVL